MCKKINAYRHGNIVYHSFTTQQEFAHLLGLVIRALATKTPVKPSNSCQHNLQCAFKINIKAAETFACY